MGARSYQKRTKVTAHEALQIHLAGEPATWLVTGVAGFIGGNLREILLKLNRRVARLDNFASGHQRNLDEVRILVTTAQWGNLSFIKGDFRELTDCQKGCEGVDHVLH